LQDKAGPVMSAFEKHFIGENFKKGTEVRLAMSRGGEVTSFVNGTPVRYSPSFKKRHAFWMPHATFE
jgi:hypothetical protein